MLSFLIFSVITVTWAAPGIQLNYQAQSSLGGLNSALNFGGLAQLNNPLLTHLNLGGGQGLFNLGGLQHGGAGQIAPTLGVNGHPYQHVVHPHQHGVYQHQHPALLNLGGLLQGNARSLGLGGLTGLSNGLSGGGIAGGLHTLISGAGHALPLTKTHFYLHSAPEDHTELTKTKHISIGHPQKNYRVVFIRAPSSNSANAHISVSQAPQEEKTVIYVLTKKQEDININHIATPVPTEPSKPEVFFIKYKTPEEAIHAQTHIQAQYDSLGGSSQITDAGIAPVSSVIGILGQHSGIGKHGSVDLIEQQSAIAALEQHPTVVSLGQHPTIAALGQHPTIASLGQHPTLASLGQHPTIAALGQHPTIAALGQHPTIASVGQHPTLAALGHHSAIASLGQYPTIASFGQHPTIAALGQHSTIAALGQHPTIASLGQHPTLASLGQHPTIAALGQHPTIAALGQHPTIASLGQHPTLAALGHHSAIASLGQYPTIASSGQHLGISSLGQNTGIGLHSHNSVVVESALPTKGSYLPPHA